MTLNPRPPITKRDLDRLDPQHRQILEQLAAVPIRKGAMPSIRELAKAHLQDLADAERERQPNLRPEQALSRALRTKEGAEAYGFMESPLSSLSPLSYMGALLLLENVK